MSHQETGKLEKHSTGSESRIELLQPKLELQQEHSERRKETLSSEQVIGMQSLVQIHFDVCNVRYSLMRYSLNKLLRSRAS